MGTAGRTRVIATGTEIDDSDGEAPHLIVARNGGLVYVRCAGNRPTGSSTIDTSTPAPQALAHWPYRVPPTDAAGDWMHP